MFGFCDGVCDSVATATSLLAVKPPLPIEELLSVRDRVDCGSKGLVERGVTSIVASELSEEELVASAPRSRIPITGGTFLIQGADVRASLGGKSEGSTWAGEPRELRDLTTDVGARGGDLEEP